LNSNQVLSFPSKIPRKVTFSAFDNSSAFNSVLQVFLRIPEFVELFVNVEKIRKISASDLIPKFALVFVAASHIHSGTINTKSLYTDLRITEKNPIFILQNLINRFQIETSKIFLSFTSCQGTILSSVSCTVCTNFQDFSNHFTYLNLPQKKSLSKIFSSFFGLTVGKHYCIKCGFDQDSYIKKSLKTYPEILIICLKKSSLKRKKTIKIKKSLNFGCFYRLFSFISKEKGEYSTFVEGCNSWTRYSDEKVEKVRKSSISCSSLFILIYKKLI
jgi:hypothetical protein